MKGLVALLAFPFLGNGFLPNHTPSFRGASMTPLTPLGARIRVSDFNPFRGHHNPHIMPYQQLEELEAKMENFVPASGTPVSQRDLRTFEKVYRGYVARNRVMHSVLMGKHVSIKKDIVGRIRPFKHAWTVQHQKPRTSIEQLDYTYGLAVIYREALIAADTIADLERVCGLSYAAYIKQNEQLFQKLCEQYPIQSSNLLLFQSAWKEADAKLGPSVKRQALSKEELIPAQEEATAFRLAMQTFQRMMLLED